MSDDLIRRAYPLLAAWNCELERTKTREVTRKPVKQWLVEAREHLKDSKGG